MRWCRYTVVQVHGGAGTGLPRARRPLGSPVQPGSGATRADAPRLRPGRALPSGNRRGSPWRSPSRCTTRSPDGSPAAAPPWIAPAGNPRGDPHRKPAERHPGKATPRKDDTPRGVPVGTRGTSSRKRPDGDRPRGSPRGRLPHRETPEDTPWNVLPREALRGSPRGSPPERIPEGRPRRTSPGRSALGPPPDNAPAGSAGGRLWNVAPGRPRGAVPWITPVGWPAGMGPVGLAPGSPVGGRRRSGAEGGDPRGFPAGHRPKASP